MDDYSPDVTTMQSTTDPGEVGTESLPTTLADELQRLRFIIKESHSKTQWYDSTVALTGNDRIAPHEGLVVKKASNSTADIDADAVLLFDTDGAPYRATSVNLTVDITASGANGLDTGAEASSTWYYLWVIYNGTTVAGLISTQNASPTMPTGYTFKGLVGAIRNDSGSNFVQMFQTGEFVAASNTTVLSGGTSTSNASVDLSAVVPVNARVCRVLVRGNKASSSGNMSCSVYSDSGDVFLAASCFATSISVNDGEQTIADVQLQTAQTIYYKVVTNTTCTIIFLGWHW